jgi:hypothetical protein
MKGGSDDKAASEDKSATKKTSDKPVTPAKATTEKTTIIDKPVQEETAPAKPAKKFEGK